MRKKEIKNIASFYWREDVGYITLPGGSDGKESACSLGDPGLIPGVGRGVWQATVHGVAKSWT